VAHQSANNQPVTVLHQGVSDVAKGCRLAVTFAIELRLGISRALVRLVRTLLTPEVPLGIATGANIIVTAAILRLEALCRGLSRDQSAVNREVFVR
jgi:hypothetical protein